MAVTTLITAQLSDASGDWAFAVQCPEGEEPAPPAGMAWPVACEVMADWQAPMFGKPSDGWGDLVTPLSLGLTWADDGGAASAAYAGEWEETDRTLRVTATVPDGAGGTRSLDFPLRSKRFKRSERIDELGAPEISVTYYDGLTALADLEAPRLGGRTVEDVLRRALQQGQPLGVDFDLGTSAVGASPTTAESIRFPASADEGLEAGELPTARDAVLACCEALGLGVHLDMERGAWRVQPPELGGQARTIHPRDLTGSGTSAALAAREHGLGSDALAGEAERRYIDALAVVAVRDGRANLFRNGSFYETYEESGQLAPAHWAISGEDAEVIEGAGAERNTLRLTGDLASASQGGAVPGGAPTRLRIVADALARVRLSATVSMHATSDPADAGEITVAATGTSGQAYWLTDAGAWSTSAASILATTPVSIVADATPEDMDLIVTLANSVAGAGDGADFRDLTLDYALAGGGDVETALFYNRRAGSGARIEIEGGQGLERYDGAVWAEAEAWDDDVLGLRFETLAEMRAAREFARRPIGGAVLRGALVGCILPGSRVSLSARGEAMIVLPSGGQVEAGGSTSGSFVITTY